MFADEADKIALDVLKQFASDKIEEEWLNELTIAVKEHIRYVAKCMNNGLTVEINHPEPVPPPSADETDTPEA